MATSVANNICVVYGKGTYFIGSYVQKENLIDFGKKILIWMMSHESNPVEMNEDRINNLLNETRSASVQEMSQMINMSESRVHRQIKRKRE